MISDRKIKFLKTVTWKDGLMTYWAGKAISPTQRTVVAQGGGLEEIYINRRISLALGSIERLDLELGFHLQMPPEEKVMDRFRGRFGGGGVSIGEVETTFSTERKMKEVMDQETSLIERPRETGIRGTAVIACRGDRINNKRRKSMKKSRRE